MNKIRYNRKANHVVIHLVVSEHIVRRVPEVNTVVVVSYVVPSNNVVSRNLLHIEIRKESNAIEVVPDFHILHCNTVPIIDKDSSRVSISLERVAASIKRNIVSFNGDGISSNVIC